MSDPTPKGDYEAKTVPRRCRWFGHKVRPVLTADFWVAVQHRCVRCGWSPALVGEPFDSHNLSEHR